MIWRMMKKYYNEKNIRLVDLAYYGPFNSISDILGHWEDRDLVPRVNPSHNMTI